jgi:hypothetical protein
METDILISEELSVSNYEKLSNGDVRIGNVVVTNTCADGSKLCDAINWIILDKNGNLYLDSRYDTSEFQKAGCIYKKVTYAEGIAAFIGKHYNKIANIEIKMKVYETIITIID